MRYADIKPVDLNNGDGINISLWVSGCPHKCFGCHNRELWDKQVGKEFDLDTICDILKLMDRPWKPDLSILGGEPLADYNYWDICSLCLVIKESFPDRKIWLWTGYELEDLGEKTEILHHIDYLITGKFDITQKEEGLKYRGSKNQIVWKVEEGIPTCWI